jgi:hypothetical protein
VLANRRRTTTQDGRTWRRSQPEDEVADALQAEVRDFLRDVAVGESPESLRDLADLPALTSDVRQTDSTELVRADRGR